MSERRPPSNDLSGMMPPPRPLVHGAMWFDFTWQANDIRGKQFGAILASSRPASCLLGFMCATCSWWGESWKPAGRPTQHIYSTGSPYCIPNPGSCCGVVMKCDMTETYRIIYTMQQHRRRSKVNTFDLCIRGGVWLCRTCVHDDDSRLLTSLASGVDIVCLYQSDHI